MTVSQGQILEPVTGWRMSLALRGAGLIGVILFGFAFALTFLSPIHFEKAARGFLESRIEHQVRDRLEFLPEGASEGRIARLAERLVQRHDTEIAALRERLLSGLNTRITETVARLQDLSCDCRQTMSQALDIATLSRISSLERAEPQLRRVIEGRYGEIVGELMRDLRIFTGTNLLAFTLLLAISFAKPGYLRQLFVPGVLLVVATVFSSAFYIFGQNWFFTLLYNDYVGMGYAVWLVLIYGFLADILLFQARVTTTIVDGVLSGLANMFSAGPC